MFRDQPLVNPLELRKQLLIAESELNRVLLLRECRTTADKIGSVAERVQSVSSLASAAAALVAGMSAFRCDKSVPSGAKPSWLQSALKAAQMAGSLWLEFHARGRDEQGE